MSDAKWFSGCTTIHEARQEWKKLMREHHPDKGGDTATAQRINDAFDNFNTGKVNSAFDAWEAANNWRPATGAEVFAEMIRKVSEFDLTVELIGFWIYVFDSYEYRAQLKALGFWYSGKHKAWIFNGSDKGRKFQRTALTIDQIRDNHGSTVVKTRNQHERIED